MISDLLYQKAREFRKTSLWERMAEDQMFAVRLAEGRMGYVSVMGLRGEHHALALYVGEAGLRSYFVLDGEDIDRERTVTEYIPQLQNLDCIQVHFCGKAEMPEESLEAARTFAKRNGERFAGKNAYPLFMRNDAGYDIRFELTEQEEDDMLAALEAALEVAKDRSLSHRTPGQFVGVDRTTEKIVLLEKTEDGFVKKLIPFQQPEPYRIPEGKTFDERAEARLRKLPKHGTWQMGLMSALEPSAWELSERRVFPVHLAVLDADEDEEIRVQPVALYEQRTDVMLNKLMEAIERYGDRPARIEVEDEFTEKLLHTWCGKQKIELVIEPELPELEEVKWGIAMSLGEDLPEMSYEQAENMVDMMLLLENDVLCMMADEMGPELIVLDLSVGIDENCPASLRSKVRRLIHKLDQLEPKWRDEDWGEPKLADAEKMETEQMSFFDGVPDLLEGLDREDLVRRDDRDEEDLPFTDTDAKGEEPARLCVLSVSLGKGCYRHIRMPDTILLSQLAELIIWAFDFDNDHAHAFFMDNRAWSQKDCYYMEGIDPFYRTTEQYTLRDTGIRKDKKFKFIFDFGDEWTFQCRVLQISEGPADVNETGYAQVIRSVGWAPPQYGWEEWEDEADWDDGEK